MKNINELSELEIRNLTDEDVELMKRLALAEAGCRIIDRPKDVELFDIPEPDVAVYYIPYFDTGFKDRDEAEQFLSLVLRCKSIGFIDYDYQKTDSSTRYFKMQLGKSKSYFDENQLSVQTKYVYAYDTYCEIAETVRKNKKMTEQLKADQEQYDNHVSKMSEITQEITDRVVEVRMKYERLDDLATRFAKDYLPISENNHDIALNFLCRAYTITDDEKQYIIEKAQDIINDTLL